MRRKTVSGTMLTLLLIGMLILTFHIQPVKASGTIHIRPDGSVDPDTAPISTVDNITYTFTDNIYDSIVVERDNIVVDGAGYTVQGTGSGRGIYLSGRNNVTIKNVKIKAFLDGIYLYESSNISISGNNITANDRYGMWLDSSSNYNSIFRNNVANNMEGISLSNNCSNNVLAGNNATANIARGIFLIASSSNNTLTENNATNNHSGIFLTASSNNNTLTENNATNNWIGIDLYDSSNNIISGNKVAKNKHGIFLMSSGYNCLSGNDVTANERTGIWLSLECHYNRLFDNNITTTYWRGIDIGDSSNNSIYHNNFVENHFYQVDTDNSVNFWDDGYPSGGNYWSDYTGVDVKSGPNQDQPGSDGIGDTAYVIDGNNTDHYPLMYPWGSPPPPSYTLTIFSSPTGVTFTVNGVYRITPWSGTYSEGASVSLVMPQTHNGYVWSHWLEDGDPNRIKTVTMDTDITLTAVYSPAHKPVGGKATPINIPINKPELQTPWIWLTTIILSLVLAGVYVKKRKRNTRTLPYVKC